MKDVQFEVLNGKLVIENKKIDKKIENLIILKNILDDTGIGYEEVKTKHGEEIADLFDNVPYGPSDSQYKCYISSAKIVAYDENANKYEAWVISLSRFYLK